MWGYVSIWLKIFIYYCNNNKMPRSPTLSQTVKTLSSIKHNLQFGKEFVKDYHHFFYIMLFLYPIITLIMLLYIKPKFILYRGLYPLDDHVEKYNQVCYRRLIIWFIIFQLPMVLYFLINTCK